MARTRTEGLERLKARIAGLPAAAKAKMRLANEDSARFMWGSVRIALKRGDPKGGHLEDTVRVEKGQTETGYLTKVGDAAHPYPLHLEGGHKAPDGSHVPPNPFWNPARKRALKRHKSKMKPLLQAVVAQITK